jgi:hypothetical protein
VFNCLVPVIGAGLTVSLYQSYQLYVLARGSVV